MRIEELEICGVAAAVMYNVGEDTYIVRRLPLRRIHEHDAIESHSNILVMAKISVATKVHVTNGCIQVHSSSKQ